jgi:protein TonB
MSHTLSFPISRYGLAGSISLLTTLVMFLLLFDAIKAPPGQVIKPVPVDPPVFEPLQPNSPVGPMQERLKAVKPVVGETVVPVPPEVITVPPDEHVLPADRRGFKFISGPRSSTPLPLEGEVMAVVKIRPIYPVIAEARGIEGYAVVEYNVTASGTTHDIRIIEAVPANVFDQAAIDAIAKYRFKPRVVNGAAVETRGLREKFIFELK